MSTDDDFEATLRRRLADLASAPEAERDWADPEPTARERAAAGIAPDDDPAVVTPLPVRPTRRRWLPGLAVAAVLLAVVAGAGLGIRALAGSGGSSGSASSAEGAAVAGGSSCAVPGCDATAAPPSGPTAGGADAGTTGGSGTCSTAASSTGPLAAVATIRPSGIVGSRTTSGGTAAVPYQLTFAESGGSAQVRAAKAELVVDGRLCAVAGTAEPNSVQVVPVEPGPGSSGSATFTAVDASGDPLPAGEYQVAVVIGYEVDGSGTAQLVSPPVTLTVAAS